MAKRSKKEAEDLLQTHVLNLAEIRQASEKMIKKEYRKHAFYLSIVGIFLIVVGLSFPKLQVLFVKETKKEVIRYATKVEKNTIICLSEFVDESNTYKIGTKRVYTFDSKGLTSSDSITSISLINQNDTTTLSMLENRYKELYRNATGIENTIFIDNNVLKFKQFIPNYKLFDVNTYNPEINGVSRSNIFKGKETMEEVKQKEISLGSACS